MASLPPIGAYVEAANLVNQVSLNGVRGTVISHQTPTDPSGVGSAVVQFEGGHQPMSLRPQNLRLVERHTFAVGDMLEATGLKNNVSLNGLVGKVLNVQQVNNSNVYTTEFPPPHGVVTVGANNAKVPERLGTDGFSPGSRVKAVGLVSQTALNGQVGTVVSVQKPDTIVCQFSEPHGTLALKTKNLMLHTEAVQPPAAQASEPAALHSPAAPASPTSTGTESVQDQFPVNSDVVAQQIQSRPDMNGSTGTVMGHRAGPDGKTQVIVRFAEHGTVALMPNNVRKAAVTNGASLATEFPLGTAVKAHSMAHNVALEGVVGRVSGYNEPQGQVVVFFHNFGMIALKRQNCARADGPAAGAPAQDMEIQRALNSLRAPSLPPVAVEGFLNKKTPAMGREFDRRWFVLRGTQLIYYEEKGRIPLSAQHAVQEGPNDVFLISGPGMSRTFELKADTCAAKHGWIQALEKAVRGQNEPQACMLHLDALESAARYKLESEWAYSYPQAPVPAAQERTGSVDTQAVTDLQAKLAALEQQLAEEKSKLAIAEASKASLTEALQQAQEMQSTTVTQAQEVEAAQARISELEARAERAEQLHQSSAAELSSVREQHAREVADLKQLHEAALNAQPAGTEAAPEPAAVVPEAAPATLPAPEAPSAPEPSPEPAQPASTFELVEDVTPTADAAPAAAPVDDSMFLLAD